MTELKEAYSAGPVVTVAAGPDGDGVVASLSPHCPYCSVWAGFSMELQGRAALRVQCRNRRCGRHYSVRRESRVLG